MQAVVVAGRKGDKRNMTCRPVVGAIAVAVVVVGGDGYDGGGG